MDDAVRLKQWSEKMGYVHCNDFGPVDTADLTKLCKERTRRLWDDVQSRVKPLSEVEHIRKNILLSRIRKGENDSILELSGPLARQVRMRHELQRLQGQKQALCDELSTLESSIKNVRRSMTKKHTQAVFIQNQLKQFQLKREMIRMKKGDCEFFKSSLDGLNATAKNLLSSEIESSKLPGKDVTSIRLEKCMKLVKDYQTWCEESAKAGCIMEEEEYQSEQKQRKEALWKSVSAIVGSIPPEELWNSVLSHFMEKSVMEMASLASSVDLREELRTLREEALNGKQPKQDLSATHVALMLATTKHLVEADVLNRKVDLLLEDIVDGAQVNIQAETDANTSLHFTRGRMLECLRLHCRRIHLEAVKTALKEEANRIRGKTGDLASCAPRLKQEQMSVTRLDGEIVEIKTLIEQGLRSINEVKNNLMKAQKDVMDELDSFSERCTFAKDIVSTRNEEDTMPNTFSSTASSTQRNTVLNSTALSSGGSFVCSTPAPGVLKASAHSEFFQLEDTALPDLSVDGIAPRINLREIISTLRNSVSKESKTFFKLPLDLVPKVKLSVSTENISDLLVESPALIARLAHTGGSVSKQLVHLTPFVATDIQLLILQVFQNLGHLRASRLQRLLSTVSPPTTLCAELTQDYLKVTAPDRESNIRENLNQIVTLIENTKEDVTENRELFHIWVQRPVDGMVPDTLEVDGQTLKEWKRKYDAVVAQLK